MQSRSPHQALVDAIELLGSQAEMARVCKVAQPSVFKWIHGGKHLPAEKVLAVEAVTGISRHELRPDIYPLEDPRGDGPCATAGGCRTEPAGGSLDSLEGVRP